MTPDTPAGGVALFSRLDLRKLIIPLIIEQALALSVGMIDTVMVANAGAEAVSGVALVETVNILLINLFTALATGGAIVAGQYLGMRDTAAGNRAARQLVIVVTALSLAVMAVCLLLNGPILRVLFGQLSPGVMASARTYFYVTAVSYPFIALFNVAAALFRCMGNTRTAMANALVMNMANIIGNWLFMFDFGMGVFGAALSTLLSRMLAAFSMLWMLRSPRNDIYVRSYSLRRLDLSMIRRILRIGIPNGLENSVFQFGRIIVTGLVAAHGTASIAAHATANSLTGIEVIPGQAIGLALLTVVARCVGAGEYGQAKRYTRQLMGLAYLAMLALNAAMLVVLKPVLGLYSLSGESTELAYSIMLVHGIAATTIWTPSFVLPNALRAAGDVRFPMAVSIASMFIFRIGVSYLLVYTLEMGAISVWLAMVADWAVRSVCFLWRWRSGKWENMTVV